MSAAVAECGQFVCVADADGCEVGTRPADEGFEDVRDGDGEAVRLEEAEEEGLEGGVVGARCEGEEDDGRDDEAEEEEELCGDDVRHDGVHDDRVGERLIDDSGGQALQKSWEKEAQEQGLHPVCTRHGRHAPLSEALQAARHDKGRFRPSQTLEKWSGWPLQAVKTGHLTTTYLTKRVVVMLKTAAGPKQF